MCVCCVAVVVVVVIVYMLCFLLRPCSVCCSGSATPSTPHCRRCRSHCRCSASPSPSSTRRRSSRWCCRPCRCCRSSRSSASPSPSSTRCSRIYRHCRRCWEQQCCPSCQYGKRLAPYCMQGFSRLEHCVALQAPGDDHLGPLVCRYFESQCDLCIHLVAEPVDMGLRSSRLNSAREAQDLQVLVALFQEQLSLRWRPFGISRKCTRRQGLQDLRNSQEDLMQATAPPVNSADQARRPRHGLEEDKRHLPTLSLPFVDPILSSSQGLILSDIEDDRGLAGDRVHEPLLENGLDIVPPSERPRATWCRSRYLRDSRIQDVSGEATKVEALAVQLPRPLQGI